MEPKITQERLQKINSLLFIIPASVRSYVHLHVYLKAFSEKFNNISIDLWIHATKNQSPIALSTWAETLPWLSVKNCLEQAQKKQYPLIISLVKEDMLSTIKLAKTISPHGEIASFAQQTRWFEWRKKRISKKINTLISFARPDNQITHTLTDQTAWWFEQLFDIQPAKVMPSITIPKPWIIATKLKFMKYKIDKKQKPFGRVYFINGYGKDQRTSLNTPVLLNLIKELKHDDKQNDVTFLLHVPPQKYAKTNKLVKKQSLNNVILFQARESFFQLPGTLALCDIIISVESDISELGYTVNKPVIIIPVENMSIISVAQKIKEQLLT